MSLARAQEDLGWPRPELLLDPPGSGAAAMASYAKQRIGTAVKCLDSGLQARIGILSRDPTTSKTEYPLAVVSEFRRPVNAQTLAELHRIAWNFSRTPLLLTVEPHQVRAFSCCELPSPPTRTGTLHQEISDACHRFNESSHPVRSLSDAANRTLHWLELSTGRFIQTRKNRFRRHKRAEVLLLSNLRSARDQLRDQKLSDRLIHSLLARTVFIQFLFDRRSSSGETALNESYLYGLYRKGILSSVHRSLSELYSNHLDTYKFFRHLDSHFNGDLFPSRSSGDSSNSNSWQREMEAVKPTHLTILSNFVSGQMEVRSGQYSLWPKYSFDLVPLELMSSMFELFANTKAGTVYTRPHLVDFILDDVLPWDGHQWDLKVLDPCCGSGIFLVKVFQRLVHRWQLANPSQNIPPEVLTSILAENIVGIDRDAEATRVASFSLYLAMCDAIEPKHYWKSVRFPILRGNRIISSDFFAEEVKGIRTKGDHGIYDLCIGNPPWGKNTIGLSPSAQKWNTLQKWPVSYGDIAPLFMAKSSELVKDSGKISLLQSSNTLLFKSSDPSRKLRKRIFDSFQVDAIVNLSTLRSKLFGKASGPAALITFSPMEPKRDTLQYICPKAVNVQGLEDFRIVIDPYDINEVSRIEAYSDPWVWSVLMWGGRRDYQLVRRLGELPSLGKYRKRGSLRVATGFRRGNRSREEPRLLNRRYFKGDFEVDIFQPLNPSHLPRNQEIRIHSRDAVQLEAFEPTQLLIKSSWTVHRERFLAFRIAVSEEGVICKHSFVSVSAAKNHLDKLESVFLSFNSKLALYFLLLADNRFPTYIPNVNFRNLLNVPCPTVPVRTGPELESLEQIDRLVFRHAGLRVPEIALIEDLCEYVLQDYRRLSDGTAHQPTKRTGWPSSTMDLELTSELHRYCRWFIRVIRANFGSRKEISARIFEESAKNLLPVRMVAILLAQLGEIEVDTEIVTSVELVQRLSEIDSFTGQSQGEGALYRRMVRTIVTVDCDGKKVPCLFIAKPDERRYWTRSIAMRDADEFVARIVSGSS